MWFFTKKINELIEKKVKEKLAQYEMDLQDNISKSQEKMKIIEKNLGILEDTCLKLQRKTFKAQGIEKIVYHPDYKQEDIARLADIAKNQFGLSNFQISRISFPIKVSEKSNYFRVKSNCAIALKGLKFIEGDGWGQYRIMRGTEILSEFSKSKLVQEEGILTNIRYMPDDALNIYQIQGEGELQVDLLGFKVTPVGFMTPLINIE